MALKVHVNCDSQDQPLGTSGVDWVEFSEGNDQLIFTNGNTEVIDGADIPSQAELISAGVILTGSQIIVSTYLLQDTSENELKSINGMGNLNKSYVLAFDFDAITASEPVLEVYDDENLNTADGAILGSGTPSSSFIRGITTTYSAPGTNWITGATRMAGSSDGNFLYLNGQNGFLTIADTLYANICVVIPASRTTGFSANPVFVCKWLEN
jgi:hypothetical protein